MMMAGDRVCEGTGIRKGGEGSFCGGDGWGRGGLCGEEGNVREIGKECLFGG